MNKRKLYESIMKNVAKLVKRTLNETLVSGPEYANDFAWALNDIMVNVGPEGSSLWENAVENLRTAIMDFTDNLVDSDNIEQLNNRQFQQNIGQAICDALKQVIEEKY